MSEQLETARSSSSQLISASALMAAGTLVSRILGFVRVALIAFVLGNGTRQAEMFTFANTIPNSIYILLAGGALNTVLVPQIVRAVKNDEDGGEAYTNRIMTAFLLIVAVVTAVVTFAAPLMIKIYTTSEWRDPALAAQYDSMVTLASLCLPQIFFYGAFFLAGQVLNARGRFGPMMWAPIANNVVSIGVFALYLVLWSGGNTSVAFSRHQELVLGLGATVGIVVQAAILVPYLRSAGFHYRPRFDLRNTGLGHTFSLAKWTLGFVVVTQAALVIINRLASRATIDGEGAGLTVYNNAYLLWIMPHSLVTVSLATAMLPSASRLAAAGDLPGVRDESMHTMRLALTVLLPMAVGFLVLAVPISELLFAQGAGSHDSIYIAWALMGFAIGLVPFTIQYICLRTFYALEDTRSTFFLQCIIAATNAGLAVIFVLAVNRPSLVAAGLALAYSLAYLLGVVISFRLLARALPGLSAAELLRHCLRLFLAVLPGALAAGGIAWAMRQWSASKPATALTLVLAAVVAVGLFIVMARMLHLSEVGDIVRTVLRRRTGSGDGDGPRGPGNGDRPAGPGKRDDLGEVGGISAVGSDAVLRKGIESPTIGEAGETAGYAATGIPIMTQAEGGTATGTADGGGADQDRADQGGTEPASPKTDAEDHPGAPQVSGGTILGGRYRMEEVLAETASTVTWRAFDQVLSRSVVCHLLPHDEGYNPDLLEAARRAAIATDSRFLRVLDATECDEGEVGCYIVNEYTAGSSLEVILATGPLTGLEAAWLIRAIADALSGIHPLGLFHLRLNPETILVTPTGNVQIAGLLIESVLHPYRQRTRTDGDDPEAIDVFDLGRLHYAALVSRWPGGAEFGLAAAPTDGHCHWLTPRQVRAGVSPALDEITDQILGDPPRHHAPKLRSATDVVHALTKVLGAADASADLERRLRQPVPMVGSGTQVPRSPAPAWYEQGGAAWADPDPDPDPPERSQSLDRSHSPAAAGRVAAAAGSRAHPSSRTDSSQQVTRPRRSRRWVPLLVVLLVLAVIGTAVGLLATRAPDRRTSADPSATISAPAPQPTRYPIVSAQDFDPKANNGNGSEHPDEVPLAYDGNPKTRWRTLEYRGNPKLGGLKPGVGLVLDLGESRTVSSVKLSLSGHGTAVEARVPKDDPAGTTEPPMDDEASWRTVAAQTKAGRTANLTFAPPVQTRFVLVYLISLPREGTQYRGGIYEIEVRG